MKLVEVAKRFYQYRDHFEVRSGADTVVNVATIEFGFRAIVLIEKFVLDAQAPQAQNTWCMRPLMYIENCMGKITDRKKIV